MNSQWKLVPVEPTETMVINGFESEPNECFTDDEVWEQYQEMSGCQQAAFRAKLCWAAMISSSPTSPEEDAQPVMKLEAERLWGGAGEYVVSFVKPGWLDECRKTGGEFLLYTHPDAGKVARLTAERDALQQRLNAADQRIDELTRPHGEQVAHMPVERCYEVRAKMIIAFNEAKKSGGDLDDALDAAYKSALRFSPNPLATEQPDRSPENYAIEHAEYMAKSADVVLAKFQAYGLALLAVDEGGDDGEGELLESIDSTRQDLQESLVDLRGMVYEFRKRSNRCTPQ